MNWYEAKQEARRERLEARAERLAKEGSALYNQARTMAAAIPFGQPILVGHHSEKRDRNYRKRYCAKYDRAFETMKAAETVAGRAASVGSGGISSDDPDAIAKLREELEPLEKRQAMMVAANKVVRKIVKGKATLEELAAVVGSAKAAAALMQPGMVGGMGFAHFQLTNNGANVRRIKERIAHLERASQRETTEREVAGVRLVENAEANRMQLFFPGKPSAEIRAELKSRGFRWAPSEGAWQRHLGNGARYAAECVVKKVEGLNGES